MVMCRAMILMMMKKEMMMNNKSIGESKTYARGLQEAVLEYKPSDDECPYLVTYWTGEEVIDECRFKDKEVAVGSCLAWINLED